MVDSIRDVGKWERSFKNFASWMGDVVPGASDIDFLCERNGNFLIIELKEFFDGIKMPYGQHLALFRLSKQPNTTVFLLGEKDDSLYLTQYAEKPPSFVRRGRKTVAYWEPERFAEVTREQVREEVQAWWAEAGEGNSVLAVA